MDIHIKLIFPTLIAKLIVNSNYYVVLVCTCRAGTCTKSYLRGPTYLWMHDHVPMWYWLKFSYWQIRLCCFLPTYAICTFPINLILPLRFPCCVPLVYLLCVG